MTDRPSASGHAAHDLESVAAAAGADATGSGVGPGGALIRTCAACAAVAADLQAIRAATQGLGSAFEGTHPAAPRDFRLTLADAERVRKARGWQIGSLGRARQLWRGLGTGLAVAGFAALVLSAGPLGLVTGGSAAMPGPNAEQHQDTTGVYGPGQATAPSSLVDGKASQIPVRATDLGPAPETSGGVDDATLSIVGGVSLLIGIGLILATRSGRRAGP